MKHGVFCFNNNLSDPNQRTRRTNVSTHLYVQRLPMLIWSYQISATLSVYT